MKVKVLTVIITYNALQKEWLHKCLQSLQNSDLKTDVFVVDNASKDSTLEAIRTRYTSVKLIESKENLGFAKANNLGLQYAINNNYDYVFLLNQDAWVETTTIENLINISVKNKDYGILSPIHLNGKGDNLDFNFTNYISKPGNEGRNLLHDSIRKNDLKDIYSIDFVNAACWLMPIETIKKVGFFDDILFLHYGEDGNFCQRLAYNGLKIGVVPKSFIFHDREERKGLQAQTTFSKDKELKEFISIGSNVLDAKANNKMSSSIKLSFMNYVKSLLKLSLQEAKNHKEVYKQKKSYKNLIIERKKAY